MKMGAVYWLVWILCFLFGFGWNRGWVGDYGPYGFGFICLILFFLLGWHNFGFVIQ